MRLAAGTYHLKSTWSITNDVKIVGAGPELTTITSTAKNFRLFELHGRDGAALSSLTLSGGYTPGPGLNWNYGAAGGGGAVWLDAGGVVSNCVITGCTGGRLAAGLAAFVDGGTMVDTVVTNLTVNYTDIIFGAVTLLHDAALRNCRIGNITATGIHADYPFAAVELRGGTVERTVVAETRTGYLSARTAHSAGILLEFGDGRYPRTIDHCTVVNNAITTSSGTAGIRIADVNASGTEVKDSVVYLNTADGGNITANWGSDAVNATWSHDCTAPVNGLAGTGHVEALTGVFKPDTYEPAPGSALIGAASDGTDIGAIAYVPADFSVTLATVDGATSAMDSYSGTMRATPEGETEGATYVWDLDGDGVYETSGGSEVPVSLSVCGVNTIGVKATNAGGTETVAYFYFTVNPSVVYVKAGNAGAESPYDTPSKAASSLKVAVDSAVDGATIVVDPGTYEVSQSSLTVVKNLRLVSSEGPENTVIAASGDIRAVVLEHAESVLSGFTVTNGYASSEGGDVALYNGATMTNCIVVGARSQRLAKGICVYNDNSRVYDCIIGDSVCAGGVYSYAAIFYGALYQTGADAVTDNCVIRNVRVTNIHRSSDHIQAAGAMIAGGRLERTLIHGCSHTDGPEGNGTGSAAGLLVTGGAAENCTVTGCSSGTTKSGTRLISGTIRNSIVWGNEGGPGFDRQGGTISYSDIPEGTAAGEGLRTDDPCLSTVRGIPFTATTHGFHGAGRKNDGTRTWLGYTEAKAYGMTMVFR